MFRYEVIVISFFRPLLTFILPEQTQDTGHRQSVNVIVNVLVLFTVTATVPVPVTVTATVPVTVTATVPVTITISTRLDASLVAQSIIRFFILVADWIGLWLDN